MISDKGRSFIIRRKGKLISIYHDPEEGICMTAYKNGEWRISEKIAGDVLSEFSLNISDNGDLYLFCQENNGNIILYHYNGIEWKSQIIQKNTSNTIRNIHFYSIVNGGGVCLFYNIPSDIPGSAGKYKIVMQEMSKGKWSQSISVAENVTESKPMFDIQNIKKDHYIMYYQTGNKENILGYKEFFLPSKWGSFQTAYQTINSYIDRSIVTVADGLHMAFIVKGAYSSQLIYRRKFDAEMSAPIVLFEANRIEKAVMHIHLGTIYITFYTGSYGYYSAISSDNGKTFTRPARIKTAKEAQYAKASYLCDDPHAVVKTVIYEAFTDMNNPGEVPFLEETIKDFYPTEPEETVQRADEPSDTLAAENKYLKLEIDYLKEALAERAQSILLLENKLENIGRELSGKNNQIIELNADLSRKNSELGQANISQRQAIKKMQSEIDKLISAKEVSAHSNNITEEKKDESFLSDDVLIAPIVDSGVVLDDKDEPNIESETVSVAANELIACVWNDKAAEAVGCGEENCDEKN